MKSIKNRYWQRPLPNIPSEEILRQSEEFDISPNILSILHNRGIEDDESIRKFLYPTLHDLDSPLNMKGVGEAAKLVTEILESDGEILIWGDYDVDGVTATSLLVKFLSNFSQRVRWFIPNRFVHGYGLHGPTLKEKISSLKLKNILIITVDCGIANHSEIDLAKKLGCKVIVTDHHEPGDLPVVADVIINPKQNDCHFPEENLAGVGLAFYLAVGIRSHIRKNKELLNKQYVDVNLKDLLDLVAIGTIADMVPLKECNRVLVKAGFEILNSAPNPGIAALLQESDIHTGDITSEDISFQIAPRINAAGRMDDASLAVELFLENDFKKCQKMARKLTNLNKKRKLICNECLEFTLTLLNDDETQKPSCVVESVDYSPGILGIVASQLAEKMRVPVILVSEVEDSLHGRVLKGSCRSVDGINLYSLLSECAACLLQYGGHSMAAGITLGTEQFDIFKQLFSEKITELPERVILPKDIDMEIPVEEALSSDIIYGMRCLEPFGVDNEKPILYDSKVIAQDIRMIGQNADHISFTKRGKYSNNRCIGFRFGDYFNDLKERKNVDLVYTVSVSRYKKAVNWQAYIQDII